MRIWNAAPLALAAAVALTPEAGAQVCPKVQLQGRITSGLSSPLFVTNAGDGSNRLFVVERAGTVKVVQPGAATGTVFLTIPAAKILSGDERGLLGLAFSPNFATNRRFFVTYTRSGDGAIVLAEYKANATNANIAEPTATNATEIPHLVIPHPGEANHNGGMIAFGPGGYLFMSVGDGGSGDDPPNNGQNINTLLGKFLRLDVDTPNGPTPYSSPADNPYFGATPGRDEIYAIGVRNPWRFSFDRETHRLIAGDVGQDVREEVDYIDLGKNYGWRVMEGTFCNFASDAIPCNSPLFTPPLLEYAHSSGRCSITGGYVYRGSNESLPEGTYVYGDFCTGEIFGVDVASLPLPPGVTSPSLFVDAPFQIASFGEDEAGELYAVTLGGSVNTLLAATRLVTTSAAFGDEGGDGSVDVIAPNLASCSTWSAASNVDWIDVTSGGGIKGNGTVNYHVDPNPNATPRNGTLTIAGHTFTVTQDPSAIVSVSVDDISIDEGDTGSRSATFLVTLSGASGADVTVQYASAAGTATPPADYTEKALTTLTFAPGETSKPVSVSVKGDTRDEANETFFLNLSNPTSAVIADGQAVGTILDDDASPSLSIADLSFTEGSSPKTVSAVVTLSAASGQTVTVAYATGAGSATAGSDYTAENGTLTFDPGQKTQKISIATKGDLVDEPNETFLLNLTAPTNATLADGQAVVTILDDDDAGLSASISDVTVTEGDAGTQNAVLTVTLSGLPSQTVKVGFATAPGTATAGSDYNGKTGTLTFNAGQNSKTVTVVVKGDVRDESAETFFVNLQNPQGVVVGDGQGVVTINDNDPTPSVSVSDVAVTEGNSGSKTVTFTATLSAESGNTVTVDYATADGSATAPGDYAATNGTLSFAPGQLTRNFTVAVKGDTAPEATETFSVVLTAPSHASLGDATGVATITDNDGV